MSSGSKEEKGGDTDTDDYDLAAELKVEKEKIATPPRVKAKYKSGNTPPTVRTDINGNTLRDVNGNPITTADKSLLGDLLKESGGKKSKKSKKSRKSKKSKKTRKSRK